MSELLGTLAVKLDAMTADFSRDLDSASRKVESFAGGLRGLRDTAAVAFAGLAGAIGTTLRSLEAQEQAERRLAAVAGLQGLDTSAIQDYAAHLQTLTTYGDEATISATAMMAQHGLTQDQLMRMMPAMQDAAAFMGRDLASAAQVLGQAVAGSTGRLRSLGIVLTETQREMLESATQGERVAMLADIIQDRYGGAAQSLAKTAGGAMQQLRNAFGDTLEELGRIVSGPVASVFGSLATAIGYVTRAIAGMSSGTKEMLGKIAIGVTVFAGLTAGISAAVVAIGALIAKKAIIIAGFVALKGAIILLAKPIAIAVAAMAVAVTAVGLWQRHSEQAIDAIRAAFAPAGQIFADWAEAGTNAMAAITRAGGAMSDALSSVFASLRGYVSDYLDLVMKGLRDLSSLIERVSGGKIKIDVEAIVKTSKYVAQDAAVTAVDFAVDKINAAGSAIAELGGRAVDAGKDIASGVSRTAIGAFRELDASARAGVSHFGKMFGLTDSFGDALEHTIPTFDDAAKAIKNLSTEANAAAERQSQVVSAPIRSSDSYGKSWTDAMADKMGKSGSQVSGVLGQVADKIAAGGEKLNATMSGFAQGFQSGGIIGAVIGAIIGLLSTLDGFKKMLSTMERGFRPFTELFDLVLNAIAPFFDAFGKFGEALGRMGTAMSPLAPIMGMIGAALEVVSKGFLWAAEGIEKIANWFFMAWEDALYEVGKVFRAIGIIDAANALQGPKIKREFETLVNQTIANATAQAVANSTASKISSQTGREWTDDWRDLSNGMRDFAKAARDATESLTNVPSGYKIALARFQSIDTMGQPGVANTGALLGAGVQSQVVNISTLNVTSDNAPELLEQLKSAANWQNYSQYGTLVMGAPDPGRR
jgi:hypothetical protein